MSLVCVALPFLSLFASMFSPVNENWRHVQQYLLRIYVHETIILTLCSLVTVLVLGVSLAWCMAVFDFPGKSLFSLLLVLPLAVPPYIAAYTYDSLFSYTGALQAFCRNTLNFDAATLGFSFPAMGFAVFIFGITLFPYVYLFVRAFLHNQSASVLENALLLSGGPFRAFFRVMLPLIWPSAIAGGTLASLEVLNDFGVTSFLGLQTFTTAIFSVWFGMSDVDTAVKLAGILLALALFVVLTSKAVQRSKKYRIVSSKEKGLRPKRLRGAACLPVLCLCGMVVLVSFIIPIAQMLSWALLTWESTLTPQFFRYIGNTLYAGGMACVLIMILAVSVANANRVFFDKRAVLASQASTMGYAIPAAVLAIGVITLFAAADSGVRFFLPQIKGMPLSMTISMLVFAYVVRFFSIGYQAVDTGFSKIGPIYTEVSRTLGYGVTSTFFRVDIPLIKRAIGTGFVLVFVDIIKELPLVLILRPFNFDTLGTKVYEYANNEAIQETALPSLCIILVSALFILSMQIWPQKEKRDVSGN